MPTDGRAGRPGRSALARLAGEPHRRYNPLHRRVGAGLGRADPAAVARAPRSPSRSDRPRVRSGLLPVSRATPARTATSTRTTRRRTSSPTTSRRSVRTRRSAAFDDGLLRAEGERGSCRVVCFSPRHDLTLGAMAPEAVRRVVDVWAEQTAELGRRVPLGPGLREPRRGDGRVEPASARPDLGRHGAAGRRRPRGHVAARPSGVQRRLVAVHPVQVRHPAQDARVPASSSRCQSRLRVVVPLAATGRTRRP